MKALHNFQVHVRPQDFVIPICHEGMNRSQVYSNVSASYRIVMMKVSVLVHMRVFVRLRSVCVRSLCL